MCKVYFLEGFGIIRSRFQLLASDEAVAMSYREAFRFLKSRGQLIGANDLWIACHGRQSRGHWPR